VSSTSGKRGTKELKKATREQYPIRLGLEKFRHMCPLENTLRALISLLTANSKGSFCVSASSLCFQRISSHHIAVSTNNFLLLHEPRFNFFYKLMKHQIWRRTLKQIAFHLNGKRYCLARYAKDNKSSPRMPLKSYMKETYLAVT
jgi:hypothetical protein